MSDIYAMGAIPKTALNMVCFPLKQFDISVLKEILRGGIDKIRESGASLLGGHSVDDIETKYGLSVTGIVHPDKIIKNEGAMPGDYLVLTKPLGTGIMNTGIKGSALSEESIQNLINVMAGLNKKASEAMLCVQTHAATDVTGFGLVGHLKEMIKDNVGIELFTDKIPYFQEATELSQTGFIPAGLYRNIDYYKEHVMGKKEGFLYDILFDPQTSGGLLMAIDPDDIRKFEETASNIQLGYWIIGRFINKSKGKILLI